jgi:hypothetical protein
MNIIEIVYGLGGHCEKCDASHDHPLNNVIEVKYDESNGE